MFTTIFIVLIAAALIPALLASMVEG